VSRREDLATVERALRAAGSTFPTLQSIVDTRMRYRDLVPTLMHLLGQVQDNVVLEMLARALTVREAQGKAERPLVALYRGLPISEETSHLRWVIGNALYSLKSQLVADDILAICGDPAQGTSRQMIVAALWKLKSEAAFLLLIDLLFDSTVRGHAISALGRFKDPRAVPWLKLSVNDENAWIRREARKAVAALAAHD